jgi:hypothetical protein
LSEFEQVAEKWLHLWQHLSITYRDGVKVLPPSTGHNHGGHSRGGPVANTVDGSGTGNNEWRDEWKQRVVAESGEHFKGKGGDHLGLGEQRKQPVMEGKSRNAATTARVAAAAAAASAAAAAATTGPSRVALTGMVEAIA